MFLRVEFRTFVHATEDEAKVRAALDFTTGGTRAVTATAEGYHGNPIVILQTELSRDEEIGRFWQRLTVEGQLGQVLGQLDQRLDDDLVLHLRLDKQEAFRERLRIVDHDDVITVRAKVEAYPAKREKALPAARRYLEGVMGPGPDQAAGPHAG